MTYMPNFTVKKKADKMIHRNRKFETSVGLASNDAHFSHFCNCLIYRLFPWFNNTGLVISVKRPPHSRQTSASFASNDTLVPIKRERRKTQISLSNLWKRQKSENKREHLTRKVAHLFKKMGQSSPLHFCSDQTRSVKKRDVFLTIFLRPDRCQT